MCDRFIELLNDMQDKGVIYPKNEDEVSCNVGNNVIADYLADNIFTNKYVDEKYLVIKK